MAQPLPPPQSGDDREDQAALIAAAVTAVFAAAEAALVASIAAAVRRAITTAIQGAAAAIGQRLARQAAAILATAEQRAERIVAEAIPGPVPEAVTSALEAASERAYEEAGSVYRQAIDAAIEATRGGLPYSSLSLSRIQAAQKALDDLLGKGITGYVDRAGRKWDLASYVEMATRTGVSNAYDDLHLDVVLDLRKSSPAFGKCTACELSEVNRTCLFIPRGCAHGFLSLTDPSLLMYQTSKVHDPTRDAGVRWDSFGFAWPCETPVLSHRDQSFPTLAEFSTPF